jgi:hypothetical protein
MIIDTKLGNNMATRRQMWIELPQLICLLAGDHSAAAMFWSTRTGASFCPICMLT